PLEHTTSRLSRVKQDMNMVAHDHIGAQIIESQGRGPAGATLLPNWPPLDAAKTSVPGGWCPDSGPSIQRLSRPRACPEADIVLGAGFRASARSRTASHLLDKRGAIVFGTWC